MDLEKLTKHQIVLLALLVSFVSSIATGIVTVSLMDQAPPSVTKTINQIVERTVQTVTAPAAPAAVAETQKTIVVQSDDLAAQSIASVQKAVVRIVAKGDDKLVARGVIIDANGTALTDAAALEASGAGSFEALLSDGERLPLTLEKGQGTTSPLATVAVAVGTSTGFAPAAMADPSKLQLGQSVIRIGGVGSDTVGEGVIAALPAKDEDDLEASVDTSTPGSVLLTLFGEVVGIATGESLGKGSDYYTLPSRALQAASSTPTGQAAATNTTTNS